MRVKAKKIMRSEANPPRPYHTNLFAIKRPLRLMVAMGVFLAMSGFLFVAALVVGTPPSNIQGAATSLSAAHLLALVNLTRQEAGIAPLEVNPALEQAATHKAQHMMDNGYWNHTDPNSGTTPWHFIDAAGYPYAKAGENLARDFNDSQKVIEAWLNSPAHKTNMLESSYAHTGIGIAYGLQDNKPTILIVQLFAAPLPLGNEVSRESYYSAPVIAPQPVTIIILAFSGGLGLILAGCIVFMLSHHTANKQPVVTPQNKVPSLHLWST